MSARIRILDPHVVNQIAAGEVIERPASVVKELVENALDAGATRVAVEVQEGGRALIEVADDGHGMGLEDLARAFVSHATSKVEAVGDLEHIASLGFRGEALASIGSVARVQIVSRPAEAAQGHRIVNDHGAIGPVEPSAASAGTVVRVEGLFGRVPARRKFLRTPATELGHISVLMGRFALAFPTVAFRLVQGSRTLLETGRNEERRARIAALHGPDVAEALLEVREGDEDLSVEAWAGPPSLHRGDARLEQVFLNGRHVRDRTVAHAVRQAYDGLLPPGGRRPIVFLFLRCDPALVDVNVHPAKAEVRWRTTEIVHRLVRRALRRELEGVAPGVSVPLGARSAPGVASAVEFAFTHGIGRPEAAPRTHGPVGGMSGAVGETAAPLAAGQVAEGTHPPPHEAPRAATASGLRPVGQALGTYLVLEGTDSLVLVDQHALHERILFERISERLRGEGALEVQRLLVPTVVHLDASEISTLGEETELLQRLGWLVEPFGEDAVSVTGMPAVLRRPEPEAALRDVLGVLTAGEKEGLDRTSLMGDAIDRMACRAAVMAGDVLHADEILDLLAQAEALDHSHSCPHGRPTRLTLTRAQLERWFHRTV